MKKRVGIFLCCFSFFGGGMIVSQIVAFGLFDTRSVKWNTQMGDSFLFWEKEL